MANQDYTEQDLHHAILRYFDDGGNMSFQDMEYQGYAVDKYVPPPPDPIPETKPVKNITPIVSGKKHKNKMHKPAARYGGKPVAKAIQPVKAKVAGTAPMFPNWKKMMGL